MASIVLENGIVRTLDPARPTAGALAIEGGRVAAVLERPGDAARGERVDLAGACVLPGFSDAHVHFPSWALAQRQVDLNGTGSLREVLDRLAPAVAAAPSGAWVRGRGFNERRWPDGERPHRAALDALRGDVPIALFSQDTHTLWLNSAALQRAGGDLETPGGVVERDPGGEPTGVLREEAAWRFEAAHARPGFEETLAAMRAAQPLASSRGVTAIHDKDGGRGALELFEALRHEEALTLRVWQSLPADRVEEVVASGVRPGSGSDLVRFGYLKAFMDGTLGSRTARMLDGSGVRITSTERLVRIIRQAAPAGYPLAVHAIGDLANREALDAFEATREIWRRRGLRHRIEHAQCVAREDLPRFARLGVTASVQFTHATSDRDVAEREWPDRLRGTYAWRSLWDSGARLVNGSDAPVEELDPLLGLRAAVLRTLDDRPGWRAEEALAVQQALEATTVNPAWLTYDEHRRGRLRPGFLADLVVLDRDPLAIPPEELPAVRVVATMLGGRWVHRAPPW